MATILQCPHCGNAARTAKVVPVGAKVTCTRCRKQFPFHAAENGPVADGPGEAIETIPLAELLDDDDRGSTGGRGGQRVAERPLRERLADDDRGARRVPADDDAPVGRYASFTNSKVVDNATALAARSSKERLIGGKQVRFGESRYQMAVVLFFVLLGVGYGGILGFNWLWKYIQSQSDTAKNYRERMGKAEAVTSKNSTKKGKGVTPTEPATPPPAQELVKGNAGTPVRVGEWEVCVQKAEVGRIEGLGILPQLFISLRVTNLASGPRNYWYWSKLSKNTAIRNQNLSPIGLNPAAAPKEAQRKMASKETYEDILVVESAAARFELDLTLLVPGGQGGCVIHISPAFVTKSE